MNMEALGLISKVLFDEHNTGGCLIHSGNSRSVGRFLKIRLMEVYSQQSLKFSNKLPNDTPVNERTIEFIHILPTLAQTSDFFDGLNRHAETFCRTIESNIADSIEIQDALEEINKQQRSKRINLKESLRELKGVGNYIESILNKVENGVTITDNEKTIFKFLLANILKIDQNSDNSNVEYIIKTLTKYFHPDRCSGKNSDLYSCILSNGLRIIDHIKILWDVEKTENSRSQKGISHELTIDSLIESTANLKKLSGLDRFEAYEKIRKEILAIKASVLKDNYKERLFMSIIQADSSDLMELIINRLGINNLKVNNETPLIYAIQNAAVKVVRILIEKQDINAPGLEGKTPLQVAIDCYKKRKDKDTDRNCTSDFTRIIQSLLDCHKLCVDAKDFRGKTALCHIAHQKKIDSTSFEIINKLITLGGNIDQPIMPDITVRSFLKGKLKKQEFYDIETLADNLEDFRNGRFPLIPSIAKLNTLTSMDRFEAYEIIRKEMLSLKASDLKDNYKERLLMSIIQADSSDLMEIMINRLSINNLKVNNETPLIYAIQNTAVKVVKILIEKEDINAPGLKGITPLQVAIDCYKKSKDRNANSDFTEIIQSLLDSHKLCVDAKDSEGKTALGHIALQIKINSTSLEIINKLINLGANIDQPIKYDITVRSFIKRKLNEQQFYDIETLADNLKDTRVGVEFHGDKIVALIGEYNKTSHNYDKARKKVEEAISNRKTLLQKKGCKKTVLMAAIESDSLSFIQLLLKRSDFTLDQLTTEGDSPLDYARKKGAHTIIEFLSDVVSTAGAFPTNSGNTMKSSKRPFTNTSTDGATPPKIQKMS
ncbi:MULTISPECIES: ankyrin repeat domain-containing protein [unclassified Endozoicomonas]|uniref:ankyrin repeat domain-containing protein n=1 Tax=unclassified Endozoicomonas TaxID=2644528 RepID=UPI003BB5BB9A